MTAEVWSALPSPHGPDDPPTTFAEPPRFISAEELLALPGGYGWRFELVAGELVRFPVGGLTHSNVSLGLMMPLWRWNEEDRYGTIFAADTGFVLARHPDTVLAPDLAYVSHERLPKETIGDWFVPVAPEFALEVVGDYEARRLFATKVALYLMAGSRLVWVACPETETIVTIVVNRPGHPPRVVDRNGWLDGGDVFPGFRVAAAEIFDFQKH